MREPYFDWDQDKQHQNIKKHGLDFSFASLVFSDPLALVVYDRFESGEHRWHAFAHVGNRVLLVVHTYPNGNEESDWIRVVGLREATKQERMRYEGWNADE